MITFEHYTIRALEVSDLKPYFELIERNRKRLEDFFTGTVSRTKNIEETKIFLTGLSQKRDSKQYFPFILLDNVTKEFVAFIDLKNIDWSIPKAEIGCYTDEKFAGKGLTTKAIKLFIEYAFYNFELKKYFSGLILQTKLRKF